MNIREAKEQIKKSVSIYLMKDAAGHYRIPIEKQRPIFLYGAPGIGKTAIMEQIADELDIPLVAYSMTHHTRQSALGLPYIVQKEYGGKVYDISRYTMSEIIATVYDRMEETGKKEGILFLDEINCVSETLGPSMLQFLQYKVFGNQRIPEGWIVVTAGNPPEFNRSVREFDVVTMDRLKVLEVTPDLHAWQYYAIKSGVHKAVMTYLEIKKEDFYQIESTIDGKSYVTARGWEDLSEAISMYEEKGFKVDEALIAQYLRNKRIIGEFSVYYDLFTRYRTDYQISRILLGTQDDEVNTMAKNAGFDERISVTGLLIEAILPQIKANVEWRDELKAALPAIREEKKAVAAGATREMQLNFERKAEEFNHQVAKMKEDTARIQTALANIFHFVAENYGEDNEMLILITELTVNYYSSRFISENGCEEYFHYNKKFLLYERGKRIEEEIREMEKEGILEELTI